MVHHAGSSNGGGEGVLERHKGRRLHLVLGYALQQHSEGLSQGFTHCVCSVCQNTRRHIDCVMLLAVAQESHDNSSQQGVCFCEWVLEYHLGSLSLKI